MSFSAALLLFAAIFLGVLLFQTLALWQSSRLMEVHSVRLWRSLATCFAAGPLCLALSMGAWISSLKIESYAVSAGVNWTDGLLSAQPYLVFVLQVLVVLACIRLILRVPWNDTLLATLIVVVAGFAVNYPALHGQSRLLGVVPAQTPSMAPTVLGAHTTLTCPACGWTWPFSMADRITSGRRTLGVSKPAICPNCGRTLVAPRGATVDLGDTVMVDKRRRPGRWDLVVCRSAKGDGEIVRRVVGLPGETVEIIGGDIFINGSRVSKPVNGFAELWIPVHDTRGVPAGDQPGPRWQPTGKPSHWREAAGHWVLSAANAEADPLLYSGRINDLFSYNDHPAKWQPTLDEDAPPLGDVRIECALEQFSGGGLLGVERDFRGRPVGATITAGGEVEIVASGSGEAATSEGPRLTARGTLPGGLVPGASFWFAVRDGVACVGHEGQVLASLPLGEASVEAAVQRIEGSRDPCRLQIIASRCSATLGRIVIRRDVYYRSREEVPGAGAPGFGSPHHPDKIPPGCYFVLGDNALRCSDDSRFSGPIEPANFIGVVQGIVWPPERWREFK